MVNKLAEILERWDANEGKPYKGSLIDWSAYQDAGGTDDNGAEPPLSCMCAQGQVLHVIGGWGPNRLANTEQSKADEETAKLLNISVAHAILLRNVNDKVDGAPGIVLTNPEKVLGNQASKLLDFWWRMDQMTDADWAAARDAARAAAWDAARDAAWAAARDAAWAAARAAARAAALDAARAAARAAALDAAWDAALDAAWDAALDAAWAAASEIQGAAILREQGKPFYFLPMFGFADPEAIPSRPDHYGTVSES